VQAKEERKEGNPRTEGQGCRIRAGAANAVAAAERSRGEGGGTDGSPRKESGRGAPAGFFVSAASPDVVPGVQRERRAPPYRFGVHRYQTLPGRMSVVSARNSLRRRATISAKMTGRRRVELLYSFQPSIRPTVRKVGQECNRLIASFHREVVVSIPRRRWRRVPKKLWADEWIGIVDFASASGYHRGVRLTAWRANPVVRPFRFPSTALPVDFWDMDCRPFWSV
jgi:hypothetical protein